LRLLGGAMVGKLGAALLPGRREGSAA